MTDKQREEPANRFLADIGGTNVRFALQKKGKTANHLESYRTADYADLASAIANYFQRLPVETAPKEAAFAAASVVSGDRVELTNCPWIFSIQAIRKRFGFERLDVINDFTAIALGVPEIDAGDLYKVGGGKAAEDAPIVVIGPGTGLGVSGLIPTANGEWMALSTEGGHVTMAAVTDTEAGVLQKLRERFDHVSAERVVSGPGLLNLYEAIGGKAPVPASPDELTRRALDGKEPDCLAVLHTFCEMLGTVAGDLALTLGAQGGVYVAGGILPRFRDFFAASGFRRRFEEKGRFSDYLAGIPTFVICHPEPAFLGLAKLLDHDSD
ncbi:MAG: glucokinase [Alphaproteobacteria bacterium]|nr:glucokinase [Alphaproteobacteria bacterium]